MSAALEAIGVRPRTSQRRPTKQASYELCNHAKAYLEGGQFTSGFRFLYNLLAAGTSISTPAQPYIGFIAPPAYIALASSLAVSPKFTTNTRSAYARTGADAALHYLETIHLTVDGPAYPTLRKAFSFPEPSRRRFPSHRSAATSLSPEPGADVERIAGDEANADSLWTLADDFWQVVGWAFNCSVSHKKRWRRWKPWLVIMLDFLETDWAFCVKEAEVDLSNRNAILQQSLIWHYILGNATSANRGARRRIVRAIFAKATDDSVKEFHEIWKDEIITSAHRKGKLNHRLGQTNFETGKLANHDKGQDIQDASATMSDDGQCDNSTNATEHDGTMRYMNDAIETMGGMYAIELRQRLVALLAQVAQALPSDFTPLSDLFDNILEDLIDLPTRTFQVLISTSKMTQRHQVASSANLLLPLVSGPVPDYLRYEPSQQHFESTLLPLKGTTQSYVANAKVSLLLEQMFIHMMANDSLRPTEQLKNAMEIGIQARHSAYGSVKRKKERSGEESDAKALMEACSERLLGMLKGLELKAGMAVLPLNEAKERPVYASFASGSSLSLPPDTDTEDDSMKNDST
ncbi:hypothetical protein GQ44DRAFT_733123 [Phaeosphaeriaceae sp. PMI808]|nr:hypothetical protein GQ44DRAFT_733123 [Phaeosphaeriaceae sp. PMI808]